MSSNLQEPKPPKEPQPRPEPPKNITADFGGHAPGAAIVPPPAALVPPSHPEPPTQPIERWAFEDAEAARRAGDENAARHVDLWLAVAMTPAVRNWKKGQMVTRGEYDSGITEAKNHSPAEHATRKNGAR